MDELPPVRAERQIGDDVELFARLGKRPLEQLVDVGRDDQLARRLALAEHSGKLGQQPVHGAGLAVAVEQRVQLVVERTDALQQRDVLGDVGEVVRMLGRTVEALRQVGGDLGSRRDAVAARLDDPRPEHRHEAAGLERPEQVAEMVVHGTPVSDRLECHLLPQDRAIKLLESRARVDPELICERLAGVVVGLECLGLPPGPIEGQHQLASEPLAERMHLRQSLELADHLAPQTELEVGVDPLLEGVEPQFVEPPDLALRERLEGEIGERRAAPHRQGATKLRGALDGLARTRVGQQPLEAGRIELLRLDLHEVTGRPRDEDLRAQHLAELRDEILERGRCRLRRLLTPELVDDPVGRDRLAAPGQEQTQERTLLLAAKR